VTKRHPQAGTHAGSNGWASRRRWLQQAGAGAGLLGLAALLQDDGQLVAAPPVNAPPNPLAVKPPHHAARARSVIWLFMNGGPSQVDTWDYKPELARRDGQDLPGFDRFTGFFADAVGGLMPSPFKFAQHGECGKHVSEIFPHLAAHVDKMAFIHSGYGKSNNHSPALFMMNTGFTQMGYPCVG